MLQLSSTNALMYADDGGVVCIFQNSVPFSLPPAVRCVSLSPDPKAASLALKEPSTLHASKPSGWGMILLSLWSLHHQYICWYVMPLKMLLS